MRPTSLAVLVLLLLVVACGGLGPGASRTASSGGLGAIQHATGPTDVVLRFEEGGGFIGPAFMATQAPIFTLYGDGTVIVRNRARDPLPPLGPVTRSPPLRTARLSEDQIQQVLVDALGRAGLRAARTDYPNDRIADAPTAVFTINAGGISKEVSIYALGIDVEASPDAAARAAFALFAARLEGFDNGGPSSTDEYAPDRYRGILLGGQVGAPGANPWPWTDVAPADFVPDPDPNAFHLPVRVLSVTEVEALGIPSYQGGFQGLTLIGPGDGKVYALSLRPLLPDESK